MINIHIVNATANIVVPKMKFNIREPDFLRNLKYEVGS